MEEVFNVKEVASYLHCSESTIRKLLKNKAIPCYRIAYRIFFKKSLIDAWINSQSTLCVEVAKNE